jgi:alpha-N-arabinofuranosidase
VAAHARGRSLVARVRAPELATPRYGDVPLVSVAATHDEESGAVAVFVTNRSTAETSLRVRHEAFANWAVSSAEAMAADAEGARGRRSAATVALRPVPWSDDDHATTLSLPPRSWTMLRVATTTEERRR